MTPPLLLASGSAIRAQLLRNAGLGVEAIPARIDEEMIRVAMETEGATPRDIADALAEGKARKLGLKRPDALVLGCDQVLSFEGKVISKAETPEEQRATLEMLNGQKHQLLSAAVLYHEGKPIWRHIGTVRMTMRNCTPAYLDDYVARNWEDIRHCVGGYMLEGEGVRLFARVDGDYFSVLGLPLIELLSYLTLRGDIAG